MKNEQRKRNEKKVEGETKGVKIRFVKTFPFASHKNQIVKTVIGAVDKRHGGEDLVSESEHCEREQRTVRKEHNRTGGLDKTIGRALQEDAES